MKLVMFHSQATKEKAKQERRRGGIPFEATRNHKIQSSKYPITGLPCYCLQQWKQVKRRRDQLNYCTDCVFVSWGYNIVHEHGAILCESFSTFSVKNASVNSFVVLCCLIR